MSTIVVGHLFPDYLNIYADRGNIAVLARRAAWRGHELEVRGVSVGDELLLPVLAAADVEEVDLADGDGVAHADRPHLQVVAAGASSCPRHAARIVSTAMLPRSA